MLAVRGVCLLALVVMATAIDHSHVAIKRHMTKRKARSTHHVVHSNLAKLARAGVLSTSKSFALVNHAISSGSSFEGYEHAYGSGLGATSGGDEIQFHVIEVDGSSHGSLAVKNTASKVLVSSDDVDYAYAEMTAVAGDYWLVPYRPAAPISSHPIPSHDMTWHDMDRPFVQVCKRWCEEYNMQYTRQFCTSEGWSGAGPAP